MTVPEFLRGGDSLTAKQKKQREILLYLIFGGLTTLVNLIVFWLLQKAFAGHTWKIQIFEYSPDFLFVIQNIVAWVAAVTFAFVTNRAWVFVSKGPFFREMLHFFGARVGSLVLFEVLLLSLMVFVFEASTGIPKEEICVTLMTISFNWAFAIKLIVSVFVVVPANYIFSRWFVFGKQPVKNSSDKISFGHAGGCAQTEDTLVPDIFLSANRFGIKLGLERMLALSEKLENPHEDLSCIHVAGTNGKGSVVSYIASILAASDRRVGIYTSPYLERFSERIRILDGSTSLDAIQQNDAHGEISADALRKLGKRVEEAVREMLEEGFEHPTEFELVTGAAFLYFKESKCDYVVLETGLGGRLDSTNIIRAPIASIITAIGYDHTDRLGRTIGEIAGEKAGIIKHGCPVFLLSPHDTPLTKTEADEVERVIKERCEQSDSSLRIVSAEDIKERTFLSRKQFIRLRDFSDPVSIGHIGLHQAFNAALAAVSVRSMVTEEITRKGLSKAVWKGRNEVISLNPPIILDGAHNPQGIMALCSALNESFGEEFRIRAPRLIFGVMSDKDYDEMIRVLFRSASFSFREVICVSVKQERSLSAQKLADSFRRMLSEEAEFYNRPSGMYNIQGEIHAFDDAETTVREVLSQTSEDGVPIVCAGSLYLIGQVRRIFINYSGGTESDGLG